MEIGLLGDKQLGEATLRNDEVDKTYFEDLKSHQIILQSFLLIVELSFRHGAQCLYRC